MVTKMAKKSSPKTKPLKSSPAAKSRRLKQTPYKSFRISKRIKHPGKKLPSSFRLLRNSLSHLFQHRRLYFGIMLVYLILTLVLVKGFGISSGVGDLKNELTDVLEGASGQIVSSAALFGFLLTSAGTQADQVANTYQAIILLVVSLAVIWALRQTHAGNKITVKDSFYKAMYPMIPFLLVLIVIALQLIPLAIGNSIYSLAIQNAIAVTVLEQSLWFLLFFFLGLLSLYMVSSSVFALYIVTLPNVTPMQALRSARELVRYRRWIVMRKVVVMPIFLILMAGLIMIPLLMLLTPVAEWVFFVMTMAALVLVHSYMYALYRELL